MFDENELAKMGKDGSMTKRGLKSTDRVFDLSSGLGLGALGKSAFNSKTGSILPLVKGDGGNIPEYNLRNQENF